MKEVFNKNRAKKDSALRKFNVQFVALVFLSVLFISCSELEKPKTEEFYSESAPPLKKEFRWSNGKQPNTFDPAFVSAPPETDIVRAVYDGLTETDSKSLKALPAISYEWTSSQGDKVWTFKLRKNAKWSNGKSVLAGDFVQSWKRLAELGDKLPSRELLKNIQGFKEGLDKSKKDERSVPKDILKNQKEENEKAIIKGSEPQKPKEDSNDILLNKKEVAVPEIEVKVEQAEMPELANKKGVDKSKKNELGVKAIDDYTLRVTLIQPDSEFPKLVAHPVFRPVYADGVEFKDKTLKADIITNGAFSITSVNNKEVSLKKSKNYWNKDKIKLELVKFVSAKDADSALRAYREGEVDAVTNIDFKPLALKLLTPYVDFKRTTHSALNYYEFNRKKPPFNDRRVRKALAIAIERERLTNDKMEGATKPAYNFLPFNIPKNELKLTRNSSEAKDLLEKAGFPDGENFPEVKLVVNRNNIQKNIAESVAQMWEKELNIKTQIIVKEKDEFEEAKESQDYDLLRQGVVFPTADETANMISIFKPSKADAEKGIKPGEKTPAPFETNLPAYENSNSNSILTAVGVEENSDDLIVDIGDEKYILKEEDALTEVPAIPLYFPTSYSLVKAYVSGFEINALDAPSLKEVDIDSNWKPDKSGE